MIYLLFVKDFYRLLSVHRFFVHHILTYFHNLCNTASSFSYFLHFLSYLFCLIVSYLATLLPSLISCWYLILFCLIVSYWYLVFPYFVWWCLIWNISSVVDVLLISCLTIFCLLVSYWYPVLTYWQHSLCCWYLVDILLISCLTLFCLMVSYWYLVLPYFVW